MNAVAVLAANDKVDLVSGWQGLLDALEVGMPGIWKILSFVGMGLVAFALIKWAWDRRRGGGSASPLWGMLIFGAILLAPAAVIPLALRLLQGLANMGISIGNTALPG